MSTERATEGSEKTSVVGTLGWIGVTVVLAFAALLLLRWLGPVGER